MLCDRVAHSYISLPRSRYYNLEMDSIKFHGQSKLNILVFTFKWTSLSFATHVSFVSALKYKLCLVTKHLGKVE